MSVGRCHRFSEPVKGLKENPKSSLNQIIGPRVEEILLAVKQKIKDSVFGEEFSRSVIITGGGSLLTGMKDSAESVLHKKIKLKKISDAIDGTDVQIDNDFSVALGMIIFSQICEDVPGTSRKSEKVGILKKALKWLENNLQIGL